MGDRVFVKVDQSEEKTTSGILLPSSAQKKPTQGEIVGAGSAKAVKVGMRLLLRWGKEMAIRVDMDKIQRFCVTAGLLVAPQQPVPVCVLPPAV